MNDETPTANTITIKPLSHRLTLYQEELRKKKELVKKDKFQVAPLQEEKKDVSSFITPLVIRKSTVDADLINKLDESLLFEFERDGMLGSDRDDSDRLNGSAKRLLDGSASDDEFDEFGRAKPKGGGDDQPDRMAAMRPGLFRGTSFGEDDVPDKPQAVKDKEEKEAKEGLSQLLEPDSEQLRVTITVMPFSSLKKKYLEKINTMRPSQLSPKSEQKDKKTWKQKRKDQCQKETSKKESYVQIRHAWDKYEEKAQDRPVPPTEEDKQIEETLLKVEEEVVDDWVKFATKVAEDIDESDDEDDDLANWRDEAKRIKAEAEARKKAKASAEEKRRFLLARRDKAPKAATPASARKAAVASDLEDDDEGEFVDETEVGGGDKLDEKEMKNKPRSSFLDDSSDDEDDDDDDWSEDEEKPVAQSKAVKSPEPKEVVPKQVDVHTDDADERGSTKTKSSKEEKKKKKKKKKEDDADDSHKKKKEKKKSKKSKEEEAPSTPVQKKKKGVDLKDENELLLATPRNMDGSRWKNPLVGWHNMPRKQAKVVGSEIILGIPEKTDCWRKTRHNFTMDNAPFHWQKVTGDFEVIANISGNFSSMYDKAGIMVRLDERNWILTGMEFFNDRMNHSTSVTVEHTDWSLAPLPKDAEKAGVWFCLKRLGDAYETFYSFDAKKWVQTRQGLFTTKPLLYVGICGACPMGEGFKVSFDFYRCKPL